MAALGILLAAGFAGAMLQGGDAALHVSDRAPADPSSSQWFPTPIQHVVTIVLENEEDSSVFAAGPYETSLAEKYTYAVESYGVTHPSEPNYLALTGGSVFGRVGGVLQPGHQEVQVAQAEQREQARGEDQVWVTGQAEDRRDGVERKNQVGRADRDDQDEHGRRPPDRVVRWPPSAAATCRIRRAARRTRLSPVPAPPER